MDEQSNENLDSQNENEELDLNLEQEESQSDGEDTQTESESSGETPEEKIARLEKTNRQLFARLEKAKKVEKKPESKPLNQVESNPDELTSKVERLEMAERKRQFGYEHNLSPKETDAVFRLNPNPTKETLADPFVKGGLEAIRSKSRVLDATPSSSGRSATYNGKALHEMDEKEAAKNFSKVVQTMVGARRK